MASVCGVYMMLLLAKYGKHLSFGLYFTQGLVKWIWLIRIFLIRPIIGIVLNWIKAVPTF